MRQVHDFYVTLMNTRIGNTQVRLTHHSDSQLRDDDFMEPVWFVIIDELGKGTLTRRYYDGVEAREEFDEQVSEAAYRSLVGGK